MSRMTQEEYDNYTFQQIDPLPERIKKEKSNTRRFWLLSVPLGAGCGLAAISMTGSVSAFWPVWLISTVLIQAGLEGT